MDPREAMSRARRGFYEIRAQMEALAPQIAEKNGWEETDMASVMARLKQQTIPNDEIEEFYRRLEKLYRTALAKYACEIWHLTVVLRRN